MLHFRIREKFANEACREWLCKYLAARAPKLSARIPGSTPESVYKDLERTAVRVLRPEWWGMNLAHAVGVRAPDPAPPEVAEAATGDVPAAAPEVAEEAAA